jgi:hypothetical protein
VNNKKKLKQLTLPPSTVKSNLQKLQVVKKVTKNNQKEEKKKKPCHYIKTICHNIGFFVVKQLPTCGLMSVMLRSYV